MSLQLSIRTYLYLTILLMACLGIALAFSIGNVYRENTLKGHQELLSELVTLQTRQLVEVLERDATDLAFSLQSEAAFIEQIKAGAPKSIKILLDQQYQRQFASDGNIQLAGLAIFDSEFILLASSLKRVKGNPTNALCQGIIFDAAKRKGLFRSKVIHGFCTQNDLPRFAVIVPIGGFKPFAYLYLETDPTPALAGLEDEVGMPVSLRSATGELMFQSEDWKLPNEYTTLLSMEFVLGERADSPTIEIKAEYDAFSINQKLKQSRNLIILIAAIATLTATLVISLGMQLTVVRPLRTLAAKLRLLRKDKSQLGEQVEVSGNAEVSQLAGEFNSMTVELKNTYAELESMAETATLSNRAKSAFLANMSHEIRTPLTSIIGFAEMSLNTMQTVEEQRESLAMIRSSGKHLLKIINDILDLSKIEADKLEVEKISLSPIQVLEDVCALMKMQADEKGLEFIVNPIFPLSSRIISDPLRIKQILLNLCSNAIKFTEKGYVKISVRMDFKKEKIYFEVEDTGVGLSKDQIDRIFIAFNQADVTITRQFGGTGLGLSLSRKLAEMLGGNISVTSKLKEGSRFVACLSTGAIHEEDIINRFETGFVPIETDKVITTTVNTLIAGKVLLVEDNIVNQLLLSKLIKNTGADVIVVDNGQKGVDEAFAGDYDLVFMDIQMPVMDGLEAAKYLRAHAYDKPIVALTANTMKEDKALCMEAGFNDFVSKPVNQAKLVRIIKHYLGNKSAHHNAS